MGPNDSGESSLAYTIMSHPGYGVIEEDTLIDSDGIIGLPPEKTYPPFRIMYPSGEHLIGSSLTLLLSKTYSGTEIQV